MSLVSARQHQSENAGARQQSPATRQLPTPGSSLSSLPLSQAMSGSRVASHCSPMSGGSGLATSQSLAMSESSTAKDRPGSGHQARLFLQSLAAHGRPAAKSLEQRSSAHKSCSRLHSDSRAGRLSAQLLPGSDAAGGGPHMNSSPCLAQGSPSCLSPVLSDSAAAPQRRAAESLPASRAASEAGPATAGAGHAQRSSLNTAAAAARAAGRQQPGPEGPDRAAATLGQTAPGLHRATACATPPSPAVCAALWLYGTSQSQQPSAGAPTGGPLQPVIAAHALAAGNASSCACDRPDARPAPTKMFGGPSGKRSAEAALPPGAGTAGSPGKRHRVQPGTAPAPQAARAYLKALAQPASAAAPVPRPGAQADTAGQQLQEQHQEAVEQGVSAHGHLEPLPVGVSWYELHQPSEQVLRQQVEQETAEQRLRHLQVRCAGGLLRCRSCWPIGDGARGRLARRWQLVAAAYSTGVALCGSGRQESEAVLVACACTAWGAWPTTRAVQLHPAAPAGAGQYSIGVQAARQPAGVLHSSMSRLNVGLQAVKGR